MEKKERKLFDILIRDEKYGVWDRPDKEHNYGKDNGGSPTWWLKYETGMQGEKKKVEWIPYIDRGTNRPCWDINITQQNYMKYKWDEWDLRSNTHCNILCNRQKVYEFGCNDLGYAFAKAHQLIVKLSEHPFNFSDPESEIGRKIWYHEQPAIIDSLMLDQGCMMIKKDGEGGFNMKRPWDDNDMPNNWNGASEVKDDFLAPTIYWFRNDKE